ncbi:protein arginine methyltransferase NDUFAF7 homolog, mitochondrial isoform X3 [Cherax quadricarinatus]|uniref:protein arginine methyltransferase NDUFAF7 homolog, mitochondrial isoform X3 n=1 Tax=Cherax quadricarinatus TaxID=27406 RepID=UPI00387E9F4A
MGSLSKLPWKISRLYCHSHLPLVAGYWKGSISKEKYKKGRLSTCTHIRSIGTSVPVSRSQVIPNSKSPETPLLKQLKARIKLSGPLTVYDYMKEVLINPVAGYYAAGQDMFGSQGDYITSPEICQMFGELVGVWVYSEWYKLGSPKPLQLVELGPGRGTLMQDILRVLQQFGEAGSDLSVHFVEVSEELSCKQEEKLCGVVQSNKEIDIVQAYQVMLDPSSKQYTAFPTHQGLMQYRTMPFGLVTACATYVRLMRKVLDDYEKELYFKKSTTTGGSPVFWYRHLGSVPRSFSVFLANEFFDVLPIHKICKTEDGWREVLIDIDEGDGPHHLRYVLSRAETPATKVFIQPEETRDEIEVSPDAAVLCEELASRIEEDGGIALIMDYGHDGKDSSTFRNLMKHCHLDEQKSLISGFKMLTDPLKMGTRFKFLAFFPAAVKDFLKKHPPAGFYRYED